MASQKLSELTAVTSTADESLIYVADTQDAGSTFSGRKITFANLLQDFPTLTELASTAEFEGASLIGIEDPNGYYSGSDLEAALAEIGQDILLRRPGAIQFQAGEAITAGEVVVINPSTGKMELADNTSVGTYYIANENLALDAYGYFWVTGTHATLNLQTGDTYTKGAALYVSSTEPGALTHTDTGSGIVGYAQDVSPYWNMRVQALSHEDEDKLGYITVTQAVDLDDIETKANSALQDMADINALSGTLNDARVAESNVTQHQAALSITHTQVSDFDAGVQTNRLDQLAAPTADVDLNGYKLTTLATPTALTDAATKGYVDDATSGQGAFFETVRYATVGNYASLSGNLTVDGATPADNDRILVEEQTTTSENGIYLFNSAGAWTRATDANEAGEFVLNKTVYVSEGATHAGDVYALTTIPTTLDTDPIVWTKKQDSAGITDGSITTAKLADDAVTVAKIADGINVNHFSGNTTPDSEPTTYYFLAVDQSTGNIVVLDKSFVEVE